MKALCWYGKHDVRVEETPRPEDPQPARRRSAHHLHGPSAAPTCTSTTGSFRACRRATSWATSSWAKWWT